MKVKPKFKPKITRVKLNPEQAVLACSCYNTSAAVSFFSYDPVGGYCSGKGTGFGNTVFGAASS